MGTDCTVASEAAPGKVIYVIGLKFEITDLESIVEPGEDDIELPLTYVLGRMSLAYSTLNTGDKKGYVVSVCVPGALSAAETERVDKSFVKHSA
jgi:hypothetical protein